MPSSSSSSSDSFNLIRAFSLLVIAIMSARYLMAFDYSVAKLLQGFYLHPPVLLALALYSLPYYYLHNNKSQPQLSPLSTSDKRVVEWYWWNAWLYHTVMDGMSGSFHVVPVVVQQYFILDKRFEAHHVVPWLIGAIELFVMAPLCFVTMRAILNKSPYRYPLEIVTSAFQLFGMLVFVGAEVYEGQLNVPALDPVGIPGKGAWANVQFFNLYHVTYYWFGFWFCNLVWGVVPLRRIAVAVRECHQALALHQLATHDNINNGAAGTATTTNGKKKKAS
jgi:EXPERA (EXPanded EBP superfamily)